MRRTLSLRRKVGQQVVVRLLRFGIQRPAARYAEGRKLEVAAPASGADDVPATIVRVFAQHSQPTSFSTTAERDYTAWSMVSLQRPVSLSYHNCRQSSAAGVLDIGLSLMYISTVARQGPIMQLQRCGVAISHCTGCVPHTDAVYYCLTGGPPPDYDIFATRAVRFPFARSSHPPAA